MSSELPSVPEGSGKFPITLVVISANDLAASSAFYAKVFGWQVAPMSAELAGVVTPAGPTVALRSNIPAGFPAMVPFIGVPHVDAMLERVVSHGGAMEKATWKVPMVGSWTLSMANFIDNAGPGGEGARMPQTFIQEPTTPKRQSFIINYLKTFNPKNARIDSPVSAAQGYDSIYLLAAAINQAKSTEGPKIKAALENLQTPVEGVVTAYNKPFTAKDHDAITANIPVFGEVKGQRVVYAYPDDQTKASEVRVKDVNAKGALPVKK